MTYTVRAGGAEGCAWVAARTGLAVTPRARALVACRPDGPIRAAVVLDGWTSHSVQMHMASESPIAWRRLLPEAERYVFEGCRRPGDPPVLVVMGHLRSDNTPALRLACRAGFAVETRVRDVFGVGVDLVLMSYRREQWERDLQPSRMVA
jgi:hypothetical protein